MPDEARSSQRRPARKGAMEIPAGRVSILALEIAGYKRLRAVELEVKPDGLTVIGGRNGQGKSSALEAVRSLFGSARRLPDSPVHAGSPRAEIVAQLKSAGGTGYTVRRVIQPDRSTTLTVSRDDGLPIDRPQEFLSSMVGVLWFDPCAFLSQSAREQADTLRRLVGLDFGAIDQKRADLYDKRTLVGRDRDRAMGHAESMPVHPGVPDEEQSAAALVDELTGATRHNQAISQKRAKVDQGEQWLLGLQRQAKDADARCAETLRRIKELQAELEGQQQELAEKIRAAQEYEGKLVAARESAAAMNPIATDAITARIANVESVNVRVRENRARAAAFETFQSLAAEYEALTTAIASLDAEKRKQIAGAAMPVPGLGLSEDGSQILLGEYPLDQASGAEQMRVAVAVAMRMSGGLKVALVDDAEKMDPEQLALLDHTVREMGGQVIAARVSTGPEVDLIIEDGTVKEMAA